MTSSRKRVVIVGGQFAGQRIFRLLQDEFDCVIVDIKGFFEYTPSVLRCLVDKNALSDLLVDMPDCAVQSWATAIQPATGGGGRLLLSNGQHLQYDYCVVSTGSTYTAPIKTSYDRAVTKAGRRQELELAAQQLAGAGSVLVVGGGTVGVELAAEVAGRFGRSKKVVLVTSGPRLLERMPSKAGTYAQRWLEGRGVQVIKGRRVQSPQWEKWSQPGMHAVDLGEGSSLSVELVYCCIGTSACTELLDSLPLSEQDRQRCRGKGLPVQETLQVLGQQHVYACGDCALTCFERTAFLAELMSNLVADNIRRQSRGQRLLRFPQHVSAGAASPPVVSCVSLFKWSGILQFNQMVICGSAASLLKCIIEMCILRVARGSKLWLRLWVANEWLTVLAGRFLFR